MNVFFAGLATETNSFSSIPTAEEAFTVGQRRGEAVFTDRGMYGEMARRLRELAETEGGHVSPGLFASAQPGAPTVQAVYERLHRRRAGLGEGEQARRHLAALRLRQFP